MLLLLINKNILGVTIKTLVNKYIHNNMFIYYLLVIALIEFMIVFYIISNSIVFARLDISWLDLYTIADWLTFPMAEVHCMPDPLSEITIPTEDIIDYNPDMTIHTGNTTIEIYGFIN